MTSKSGPTMVPSPDCSTPGCRLAEGHGGLHRFTPLVDQLRARIRALLDALDRTTDVLDVAATFAEETRRFYYDTGDVEGERVANRVARECRTEEATVRAALKEQP